ncbi:hypothetical protein A8D95_07900 [Burkholderia cenocepacia]|nr:hypothetical protein WL90_17790 [Burkholderia cenocepacia]AQQ40499.1 hypothetical protein A8E75_15785 [Burkholderia cenocepacia]KWF65500.1 hypothetical protein WL89_10015 [Burkholderia cenocepacia]ODN65135.1 hypothetical protein BA763_02020 [Burkholderia cenocepacia]ONJ04706.1 hypothetical protein A8D83_20685 [Burkholderia cenocepacia]
MYTKFTGGQDWLTTRQIDMALIDIVSSNDERSILSNDICQSSLAHCCQLFIRNNLCSLGNVFRE